MFELIGDLVTYYSQNFSYVAQEFYRHFLMAAYGVLFAAIVSIPLGVVIARYGRLSNGVIQLANIIQTIPHLAMLSMLMLAIGLGANTVVVALFLYSILPILKNTYTGIVNVDQVLLDSGRAMGMTKGQILRMVELPLALSVIMAGLRNALVIAIGIVAIGAFFGAGGMGDIIIRGTNVTDGTAIILAGAIPTALMAIIADLIMGTLEKVFHPVKSTPKDKTGTEKEAEPA
ncbi:ABC transporter permease [Natribacillus halophilus]|uniref:Osmoprotectant transport system permease protein n=1 Tax=Natribacillus halophilus TaxID=549003 RepID=A0A1G8SF04_9BACI|nr:ABC transporter permease [Natribacillus halophilus]SDJ27771.1 osmoprotectant transport system permease protein [Natribacillus halophilus]